MFTDYTFLKIGKLPHYFWCIAHILKMAHITIFRISNVAKECLKPNEKIQGIDGESSVFSNNFDLSTMV